MQPTYTAVFGRVGKDLTVDPLFIMSTALQESGWNLVHVFGTNSSSKGKPLNNPIWHDQAGGNNIPYPTVWAWRKLGNRTGACTWPIAPKTIQGYAIDLTSNPRHMYNSNPAYPGELALRYQQLVTATGACKVAF